MTKRTQRWGAALGAVAVVAVAGTVAVPAIVGAADEPEPHPSHKNPITGTPLPDTASGSPQVIAEREGVKYVISEGRGTAEGMICFSRATAEMTMTGCDRAEALAKRGFVVAEDVPGGLRVDAYLPPGIDRVEANGRALPVIDRLFTATLGTPQASLVGKGGLGARLPMGTFGTPPEFRNR